jgi:hypothetical protein
MIDRVLIWAPACLLVFFLIDLCCLCWKPLRATQTLLYIVVAGAFVYAMSLMFATLGAWNLETSLPAALFGEPWDTLIGLPFRAFFDETASMPGEEDSEDFLGSRWTALIVFCGLINLSIGWLIYRFSKRRLLPAILRLKRNFNA